METTAKIYQKLNRLQTELKAPKGQYNSFGKYHYRSCEDIMEAVKPFLRELGLVLLLGDEMAQVGGRYYVKATATLVDAESGESVAAEAYAREEETKKGMDASQITGSASSYARKYALSGLLGLDDTKDSDAGDVGEEKPAKRAQKPQAKAQSSGVEMVQAEQFWQGIAGLGYQREYVAQRYKLALDFSCLPKGKAAEIYRELKGEQEHVQ